MFGSGGTGFGGGFGQQANSQQQQQQQPQQGGGLFGTPQQQQQPQTGAGGFGAGFGAQPSTFGVPANSGGGLFGQQPQQQPPQQQQPASGGFSFGQNTTSTPFGQTPQQNQQRPGGFGGFGAAASTPAQSTSGFGGFGAPQNNTQTPAFGAAGGTNAFGAKPAGGGLFGQPQQPPQQSAGAFGQPAGGGLFGGGAGGLGASQTGGMPTQGTSNPPYQPFVNTEKDATGTGSTNYQYASITCLPAYRAASIEELRLQDYQQGRKSGNAGPGATGALGGFGQPANTGAFGGAQQGAGGGLFGQQQQQPQQSTGFGATGTSGGLFGQQNNQQQQQQPQGGGLFGSANNTAGGLFGQQQQQQQPSGGLFGQSGTNNQQQQPGGSSGFTFGQPAQQASNTTSGFTFGQNNQQSKPAGGGLFGGGVSGGFGSSGQTGGSGFTFGASSNTGQQQQPSTGFGGTSSGGLGFGTQAQSNQPKPGGLFGSSSSAAPSFSGFGAPSTSQPADANKSFSFGGFGGASSGAPGQNNTAAPSGGLFGGQQQQPTTTSQPSSGFSFGGASQQQAPGAAGGFSFGAPSGQNNTGGFGGSSGGGGLFGQQNKPATGGLFGSQPQQQNQQPPGQQQAGTGGFSFGGGGANASGAAGGLFGGAASKPAGSGLFGGGGGFGGSSQAATSGGGLFGSSATAPAPQPGGGLFGSSQPNQSSGLFGSTQQNAGTGGLGSSLFGGGGGGGFGGSNFGQQLGGGQQSSLFGGQSQPSQASNLQANLTSNPYGTDSLFGGQAIAASPGSVLGAGAGVNGALSPQPHLPFNVSRPSAKKQAPLVPSFRPTTRGPASTRITKLRGTTPSAFREGTPGREGSPSLFTSSPASNRLLSPSTAGNLFRGLSDEVPRQQREGTPAALPPQAFVSRPSVKRLVLDDQTNRSSPAIGRSGSLFGSRAASTVRDESPAPGSASVNRNPASLFDRGTPASGRVNFSPALETAASTRSAGADRVGEETVGDDTFAGNALGRRNVRGINESPSKGIGGEIIDTSLPSLNKTASTPVKPSKEDALLPLDYNTSPPLSELRDWSHAELRAVEGFVVGRKGYGSVEFVEPVDLTTVGELSNVPGGIVQLRTKECFVYPDEDDCFYPDSGKERDGVQPGFEPKRVPGGKAKRGEGLNVPAIVHLEGCWPLDRSTREPITDGEHVRVKQLVNKLKRRTDVTFKGYEPASGTWSFRVEHFSRYGLDDEESDDGDSANNESGKDSEKKAPRQQQQQRKKTPAAARESGDDDITDDEADGDPPPFKALDEESEDEHGFMEAESVHASPATTARQQTPRAGSARLYDRSSRATTPSLQRATPQPSDAPTSQPWAASLGLEPKRMHVMQASFFGGTSGQESRTSATAVNRASPPKKGRPTESIPSNAAGFTTMRATFGSPTAQGVKAEAKAGTSTPVRPSAKTHDVFMEASEPEPLPPLIARPRKITRIELDKSVVENAHSIVLDAGLSMGRSFRAGWGPDGTVAHCGRVMKPRDGNASMPFSAIQMSKFRTFKEDTEARSTAKAIAMLKTQLAHSTVEVNDDDGCPVAYPNDALRFHDFASTLEGDKGAHYDVAIFRLASALFDEIDLKLPAGRDEPIDRSLLDEVTRMRRKNNVANWIRWYVGDAMRSEVRAQMAAPTKTSGEHIVFSYMSAGYLEDACKHAIEIGDVRLATLLAQAEAGGNDDEFRLDLLDQLSVWRTGGADTFISPEYRRVFELLSGNVLLSKGNGKRDAADRVDDVTIAGGLDWVRAFSLFLHYDQRFEAGLEETVAAYESSIGVGEGDNVVVPPLPPYLERDVKPGSKRFRDLIRSGAYQQDVLFALLKLFAQPSEFEVENLAQPLSYGPDKCSYGPAFHLIQIFAKVLRNRDLSDRVDLGVEVGALAQENNVQGNSARYDNLCVSFAMQLETLGEWTWAAFVLLHLELANSRREAIIALLARNVEKLAPITKSGDRAYPTSRGETGSDDFNSETKFLVHTLKVPEEWIHEARADLAGWRQDRYAEYNHLLRANLYGRAHDVAVCYLAPEGIIRHDFALLLDLFAPFRSHGDAHDHEGGEGAALRDEIDIPGWSSGGQVYLDYIAVCRSLPWLVATHSPALVRVADSAEAALQRQDGANRESAEDIFALIESIVGAEAAVAARRIERMACRIPSVVQRVSELFEGPAAARGHGTTMMVARSQMVASLHNCARSLKATRALGRLATLLPALDVDLHIQLPRDELAAATSLQGAAEGVAAASDECRGGGFAPPPVEIESLHFLANAYCDALVAAGTS